MASEEGYRTMTIGVKGEHWEATGDGGFRRLIDDETVTNEISWIQPCFEALSLPFERASLNAKVLYGAMAHADEFLVWTDQVEGAGNYPIPVINLPNPARDRYFGVIQGEWRDAVPKIITASESEFDAVFDQAVAAYRAKLRIPVNLSSESGGTLPLPTRQASSRCWLEVVSLVLRRRVGQGVFG